MIMNYCIALWNSPVKDKVEVLIYINKEGDNLSYFCHGLIDKNLNFTDYYSQFSQQKIEYYDSFQVIVKKQ